MKRNVHENEERGIVEVDKNKDLKKYEGAVHELTVYSRVEEVFFLDSRKYCSPENPLELHFKKLENKHLPGKNSREYNDKIVYEYYKNDVRKPVFKNIENVQKVIDLVKWLEDHGMLLTVLSLKDFWISKDGKIFLSRYHYIRVVDFTYCKNEHYDDYRIFLIDERKIPKILRCDNCHTRMEFDISNFLTGNQNDVFVQYKCPKCGLIHNMPELIAIYKKHCSNSYYTFEEIEIEEGCFEKRKKRVRRLTQNF